MKRTVWAILIMLSAAVCSVCAQAGENGQEEYSDLLDRYYYALAEGWNPVTVTVEDLPSLVYELYDQSPEWLGYQCVDLDGDGRQELLIGECHAPSNSSGPIRILYQLTDQGPERVELPESMDYLDFFGEGMVNGQGSLAEPSYIQVRNTYQVRNVEGSIAFVFQDGIYSYGDQYYKNITEEAGDTENDEEISEEEFYQLEESYYYAGLQVPAFIPFSSYTPSSTAYSDQVKAYRMPEEVTLDGRTYTFPFTFDELLNDGWTTDILSEDSWEQEGISYKEMVYPASGSCTKNGSYIDYTNARKEGSDPDADAIENWYVQSISVKEDYYAEPDSPGPYPLTVLNGIGIGDGIEGLQEYLLGEGYRFTSYVEGFKLQIKVYYDAGRDNYLEIMAESDTGIIYRLEYHYGKQASILDRIAVEGR